MKSVGICVIVGLMFLMIGCQAFGGAGTYQFELYSKDEVLALYDEHAELFDNLVKVIANDTFFEEGRRHDDVFSDAFLCTPDDEQVKLFSEDDQQVIRDFFELKPYMISYDSTKRFIKITFICDDDLNAPTNGFVFLYWLNQEDIDGCRNYIGYLSGSYQFESHSMRENWYFYYDVE